MQIRNVQVVVFGIMTLLSVVGVAGWISGFSSEFWGGVLILLGVSVGGFVTVWLAIMGFDEWLRRFAPVTAAGGRARLGPEGVLRIYEKKAFRKELLRESVSLDQITDITWYVSLFDPSGMRMLQFWDRDPELSFEILGITPKDPTLQPILEVSVRQLEVVPSTKKAVQAYLAQRVNAGTLTCNFDIHTFKPIHSALPPLAPGVTFEGKRTVLRTPNSPE